MKVKASTATAAAATMVLLLAGCDNRSTEERPVAYLAKVSGSGCSAFGCVTAVKIISGPRAGKTCELDGIKIADGDTVKVSLGSDYDEFSQRVCTLR